MKPSNPEATVAAEPVTESVVQRLDSIPFIAPRRAGTFALVAELTISSRICPSAVVASSSGVV